jgi:hypothetical protein
LENNLHALSNIGERCLIPTDDRPLGLNDLQTTGPPDQNRDNKTHNRWSESLGAGVGAHCFRKRPVSVKRARISDRRASRLRIVEAAKVKRTANGELIVGATIILRITVTSTFSDPTACSVNPGSRSQWFASGAGEFSDIGMVSRSEFLRLSCRNKARSAEGRR